MVHKESAKDQIVRETTPVIEFRIEVIVEPDEGGFHAYCPAFKGLHTSGYTQEEALRNAKDAATAYLESLIKHGEPIPVGVTIQGSNRLLGLRGKHATRYTEDLEVACTIS